MWPFRTLTVNLVPLCWESIYVCVTFCQTPTWVPEMSVSMTHVCVFMLPKCQPKSQEGVSSSKVCIVHTTGSAPRRCTAPDADMLWVLLVVVSRQENNDKVTACKETKEGFDILAHRWDTICVQDHAHGERIKIRKKEKANQQHTKHGSTFRGGGTQGE